MTAPTPPTNAPWWMQSGDPEFTSAEMAEIGRLHRVRLQGEIRQLHDLYYSPFGNTLAWHERERIHEQIRVLQEALSRIGRPINHERTPNTGRPHFFPETTEMGHAHLERLQREVWRLHNRLHSPWAVTTATQGELDEIRARIDERYMEWAIARERFTGRANECAKRLLLSCLSPDQKREFEENKRFTVVAQSGQAYTVTTAASFNVKTDEWAFCAGPQGVPVYDQMLAQKLMLETDEVRFIDAANRIPTPKALEPDVMRVRPIMGDEPHLIPRVVSQTQCEPNNPIENPDWFGRMFLFGGISSLAVGVVVNIAGAVFSRPVPGALAGGFPLAGSIGILTGTLLLLTSYYARR